jgi:DNA-binding transcriptional MerR regulator
MPCVTRYTTSEVARLCGVTERMLQYWDERGLIKPQMLGHRRQYRPDQLAAVNVLRELRSKRPFHLGKLSRLRPLRRIFQSPDFLSARFMVITLRVDHPNSRAAFLLATSNSEVNPDCREG